jgi:hypothetical protein
MVTRMAFQQGVPSPPNRKLQRHQRRRRRRRRQKRRKGTGQITTGSTSASLPCIWIPDIVETLRKLHPPPGVERPAKFKSLFAGREACGFIANLTAQTGSRLEFASKTDPNVGSLPTIIVDLAPTQKGWQFASGQRLQQKGGGLC